MTLNELKEKGYINDLYDNKALYDDGHYNDEDTVNKGNLFTFYFQYGSDSKERFNQVKNFLDSVLPKESNWYETMFNGGHEPNIGIYDADKNRLLSVGIGRKNRMFYYCTDESFDLTSQEHRSFDKYSEKDSCQLVRTILGEFELAADLHPKSCEPTPWELEAWANDEDEKEPTDDEQLAYDEELEEIYEEMDETLKLLAIFVPDLPNSMGDISPGDF
jgi:hypothetical protein